MAFGLSLGLAVALFVYVRGGDSPAVDAPLAARAPEPAPPSAADDAPADVPRPEERFDFYEVLPQFEVVVPEVELPARAAVARGSVAPAEPGAYVLQAGSFTALADADRRQATLALLGMESRIQRIAIDDDIYHRVRIGPIDDIAEVERLRRRLKDARIDSLLVKVSD